MFSIAWIRTTVKEERIGAKHLMDHGHEKHGHLEVSCSTRRLLGLRFLPFSIHFYTDVLQ